jgi:hypothetical protein
MNKATNFTTNNEKQTKPQQTNPARAGMTRSK